MTTPQEAMRNNFEAVFIAAIRNSKPGTLKDIARLCYEAALAQQGEQQPVAWTHSCNALCINGLELWCDHCPHCGKPRTTHAEQWPPGLITDIVLTVTALHKEVDIGWSPDARSHLSRLSTSIGMLATTHPAPQPAQEQVGINGLTEAETSATMSVLGLSKPAPPWYGELVRLAAWLLSPDATRNFDSLEENTHIGHRQFEKVQEATREVLRNKAWEIRKTADALAALQSAQPAQGIEEVK